MTKLTCASKQIMSLAGQEGQYFKVGLTNGFRVWFKYFRELLNKSEEDISSNILSDRLKTLLDEGIITRADDPTHKQKGI